MAKTKAKTKARTKTKTKVAKAKSAKAKSATVGKRHKTAARSATVKKSAPRKKVASTSRTAARKPGASGPVAKRSRPKQNFVVSHHRDEDFKADGLRTYARYRDLGIAAGTHGLARAHVMRFIGPCNPKDVSKLHLHDVEFQMVYILKGWMKVYLEGEGEILMRAGSCWTQPPRIRHFIRDYSDDCELLEVILPADFETVDLTV